MLVGCLVSRVFCCSMLCGDVSCASGSPQGGTCLFRTRISKAICEYGLLFAHYRLQCLLDGLLVRHTKTLCRLLPPLKGPVVYSIRMAEQEKATYNDLVELTRRNLFCTYFSRTNPVSLVQAVDVPSMLFSPSILSLSVQLSIYYSVRQRRCSAGQHPPGSLLSAFSLGGPTSCSFSLGCYGPMVSLCWSLYVLSSGSCVHSVPSCECLSSWWASVCLAGLAVPQ